MDSSATRLIFEWDAENDQYICPEGHALKQFRRNHSDPNRGPTGKGTARYRALKEVCQACPSKAKCCPNADARKISREEHEDARQIARDIHCPAVHVYMHERGQNPPVRYLDEAPEKVEMLFAHLKRILGLGRLRLRGPCGANVFASGLRGPTGATTPAHSVLAATAQNLSKLAKLFPAQQQTRKA